MAISTALPIRLSTVIAEIGLPASSSLQDCFDNATGTFNATYAKTGEWLSEFRGYNHSVPVTDVVSLATGVNGSAACTAYADPLNRSNYYIPTGQTWDGTAPTYLYTDVAGTIYASSGYYSNGTTWRIWNGTGWSGSGSC